MKIKYCRRAVILGLVLLLLASLGGRNKAKANQVETALFDLPAPTKMVPLSRPRSYPILKGVKVNPENPLELEFIIDPNDRPELSREDANRLIEYFLAAITIPEEDLWVNLSPYQRDKVIPDKLALTDLGKDMLSQDYILKQLVSTVTYPENELGKKYWQRLYEEVYQLAGTTNISIDTFNKVWIVPDKAHIYENDNIAIVDNARLKVLNEEDYLALSNNQRGSQQTDKINQLSAEAMKEIILPEIEWDVNHGQNFAKLRQIYNSYILAIWFKEKFKDSIFQSYIKQGKIYGIDLEDKNVKDNIYNLYIEAHGKGIYDYVKKDYDPAGQKYVQRRYYSGGENLTSPPELSVSPIDEANVNPECTHVKGNLQFLDGFSSAHHLSPEDLALLNLDEDPNPKHAYERDRTCRQIVQIEKSLGNTAEAAAIKAREVADKIEAKQIKFKKEETHILDGVGENARVIGRIDRGVGETLGYPHEVASVILLINGKISLQVRNKRDDTDDHFGLCAGHLYVGQSHFEGALMEMAQEARIKNAKSQLVFVGCESYDEGGNNRERRWWFVKNVIPEEKKEMLDNETQEMVEAGIKKEELTREQYKDALLELYDQGDGLGEVVGTYEFTLKEILNAKRGENPQSRYGIKKGFKEYPYLEVRDTFGGKEDTRKIFFTETMIRLVESGRLEEYYKKAQKNRGKDDFGGIAFARNALDLDIARSAIKFNLPQEKILEVQNAVGCRYVASEITKGVDADGFLGKK